MDIRLSEPTTNTRPGFKTALGCVEWLQAVPLINVAPSQGRLLEEIESLNAAEIPADERLKILECLLDAVNFLQSEHARKFAGRAIPLGRQERDILAAVVALWAALGVGYRRCVDAIRDHRLLGRRQPLAIALQRTIWCAAQELHEYHKCHQEPPAALWSRLYENYLLVERFDVALEPVSSPIRKAASQTHCMGAIAHAVLLAASNPNELTSRQIAATARWLDRLATKAAIRAADAATPAEEGPGESLSIDLAEDRGPLRGRAEPASSSLRVIETKELSKSLRKRIALLHKGESPASLGLGDDVPPQFAESLLKHLHRMWCEEPRPRNLSRRAATERCLLATGMGSIHFNITGTRFRQPVAFAEFSKIQHDEIATFGRVATRIDESPARHEEFGLEAWTIVDESPAGLRIARTSGESRFAHSQLVAIRAGSAETFMLGTVRWLAVDRNADVKIGLRLLPGNPKGISIRASGPGALRDKFVPALFLASVPALGAPAALVLPAGWYKPQRVIQTDGLDESGELRLTALLDRGLDFERATFERA